MKDNQYVVALTGATGAMGGEVLSHLLQSEKNYAIRLLVRNPDSAKSFFKSLLKKGKNRITIIQGSLQDDHALSHLIEDADYVVHCAAVIPPKADHNPENTVKVNYTGTVKIVDAIKNSGRADEIKYVHISTVAVYGNRDYHHPWCRMGDPVMGSAYDFYSASKIKGERYVLESGLKNWVVLRQSAVYHKYFLANNMNDGLMFHTCWNAPFEWITDSDSGLMIEHLVDYDIDGKLNGFWRNDYNIGGGASCRETGYDTFNSGFALMGANAEKFFEPHWNIPRNFHGVWYTDTHVLDSWLHYRRESSADFWKRMEKQLWYYKLGKLLPAKLIRKFAIERLLKNSNSPLSWIRLGKKGRIDAFWGGMKAYEELPKSWDKFPVLSKGQTPEGKIDYADLKDESKADRYKLSHGYDESKADSELDISDMKSAAVFRGGEVLSSSMQKGDLHTALEWKCHNGHSFKSTPFAILKAGFWCPVCCEPLPPESKWNYDKLSASIPFYAQVWYDTHSKEEVNNEYPYDEHEDDDLLVSAKKL